MQVYDIDEEKLNFYFLVHLAGGHGIVPVNWKKFWVVVKLGKIYCYKTSFNMQADYLFIVNDYAVESSTEKKRNL